MQESLVVHLVGKWGYLAIFGSMALEGLSIPFPGAFLVMLAGALSTQLQLNYWLIGLLAMSGYVLGTLFPYYLARRGGRQLLYRLGKYVFLTPERLEIAESWFERYGSWVVCLSRPFFWGNYVSYLAGLAKMNLGQFIFFTLLGVLPWCLALSLLGHYFGRAAQLIWQKFGIWAAIIFLLVMIPLGLIAKAFLRRLKINLETKDNE